MIDRESRRSAFVFFFLDRVCRDSEKLLPVFADWTGFFFICFAYINRGAVNQNGYKNGLFVCENTCFKIKIKVLYKYS